MDIFVMVEGRRMMRLSRELTQDAFDALLEDYGRLLRGVLGTAGGREVEVERDTATAAFPSANQAARAAVAVQRAVQAHAWPHGRGQSVSVGIGKAAELCEQLWDAAEGGQIFLSQAAAALLEEEGLGELSVRDLGEPSTRRTGQQIRACELLGR